MVSNRETTILTGDCELCITMATNQKEKQNLF